MTPDEARHMAFTGIRAKAYGELFGDKPVAVFQSHKLRGESDGPHIIDVFVYSMNLEGDDRPIYATVTNGMSDQRMVEGDSSDQPRRRELIQYLRECTEGHAKSHGSRCSTVSSSTPSTVSLGNGRQFRAHRGRMRSSYCRCPTRIKSSPSESKVTKCHSSGTSRFRITSATSSRSTEPMPFWIEWSRWVYRGSLKRSIGHHSSISERPRQCAAPSASSRFQFGRLSAQMYLRGEKPSPRFSSKRAVLLHRPWGAYSVRRSPRRVPPAAARAAAG